MKYKVSCQFLVQLSDILAKINPVEMVTAKNAAEAKDDWVKKAKDGFFTDPYLMYDRDLLKKINSYNADLLMAKSRVQHGVISENAQQEAIKLLLLNRIEDAIITTEMAASILLSDDAGTTELSKKLYGAPSNSQIVMAYDIVNGEVKRPVLKSRFMKKDQKALEAMNFNASEIAHWFTEALKIYGIEGWLIDVSKNYTSIDVRDKNSTGTPTICIPEKRTVNGLKLLELIGHEIESHLRGSENCKALIAGVLEEKSPLAPLYPIIAKSDNELFYEGVAKISDVGINGSDGLPLPYASIAYNQARHGSNFGEIAEVIFEMRMKNTSIKKTAKKGEDEDERRRDAALKGAWTTTYRIMRGATNTAKGGYSFTKDYIYASGYEVARLTNPKYLDFGSMTIPELTSLYEYGHFNLEPKYPYKDAVSKIKEQLLSK